MKYLEENLKENAKKMDIDLSEVEHWIRIFTSNGLDRGSLGLSGCLLPQRIVDLTSKSLGRAINVVELNMSDNYLNEEDMAKILKSLTYNKSISTLNLSNARISGHLLRCLASLMEINQSLIRLILSDNPIGLDVESFSTFCQSLQVNTHLTQIDLRNCSISPTTADYLAIALSSNQIMRTVNLNANHIGSKGGSSLLRMLKVNTSLSELFLERNQIPVETLEAIEMCLQHNSIMMSTKSQIIAKTTSLTEELKTTKVMMGKEIHNVQTAYNNMENKSLKMEKDFSFEKGKLEGKIQELLTENGKLKGKLSATQQALMVAEDQVRFQLSREDEQRKMIHDLRKGFDEHEKNLRQDWFEQKSNYESTIGQLENELQHLNFEKNKLENSLNDTERRLAKSEKFSVKIASDYQAELESLIQKMTNDVEKEKSEMVSQHQKENERLEMEIDKQKRFLMADIEKYKFEVQQAKIENEENAKRIYEQTATEKETRTALLRSEIEHLKLKIKAQEEANLQQVESLKQSQFALAKLTGEKELLEMNYKLTNQKVESCDQQKESVILAMKTHFEQKLSKLTELEEECEANSLKLAEQQDEIEGFKSKEKQLQLELQKKEMVIQKLRDDEASKSQQLLMAVKMFIGEA